MTVHTLDDRVLIGAFHALGEETRLRIVRLLSEGERCVCELQSDLGAAQSRLSFHLKKLKDAGLVTDRREGRWAYYSLAPGAVEGLREFLGNVVSAEPWERVSGCEDVGCG